jgi:hypothetical protein
MSVPVTLQPDEDVGCIQVRPPGDDLPSVFNTRSQVIQSGGRTSIEIRSQQPIDEPAIGLVLSVGCASPVARDYVLFLDPPVVSATTADAAPAADLPPRSIPPSPRRAAPRPAAAAPAAAAGPSSRETRSAPLPRPPRSRQPTASASPPRANSSSPQAASTPTTRAPAGGGDRLSIVPTEPPVVGRTSRSPQPGVFPPPVTASTPATPGVAATIGAPEPAAAAASPTATAITPEAPGDAEAVAREDALRQQQAALQAQIKTLSDQIAALRVQTTSLAARNQTLEETAFSPMLVWLLIALAVVAIVVAGWMSWRYTQLRRSLEGSAWWTANTTQESGTVASVVDPSSDLAALDGGTRMGARPVAQSDLRSAPAPVAPAAVVSNVERARPTVRSGSYPAAMDTDFTVSDIEAAMATVRTVSPPRDAKAAKPLEDSDFAPLGGPTIPSPFAEPPAAAPAPHQEPPSDSLGTFVDLDISPVQPLAPRTARDIVAPGAPSPVESKPVDFKFDVPDHFDPLATDSLKTTVFDHGEPADPVDFDMPTNSGLDFDLPTATQIGSMAMLLDDAEAHAGSPRHAAAALDDLFAPADGYGIDTILDLDEREGTPLSATEVDRLTEPDQADPADHPSPALMRSRMARFAALLDRVDEVSTTDPLRAIAQLRQFVLRDEQIPTLLWLRLFELYRRVDKKPVYEALAEHFARRYHRPMASWNQVLADVVPQKPLSAMPTIDRAIEAQWGTDAGIELLQTLLCDRAQEDEIVFNAVLQRDLLDAAKIFPKSGQPNAGPDPDEFGESPV